MAKTSFMDVLGNVPNEFRPVAFWFINHFSREDELRRQIREMAEKGFGGIMFHARDGLRGGYLNAEWRDVLACSIDEARIHGMDVWLYDELNYPSGPAGGRLYDFFPDSTMKCLKVVYERKLHSGDSISVDFNHMEEARAKNMPANCPVGSETSAVAATLCSRVPIPKNPIQDKMIYAYAIGEDGRIENLISSISDGLLKWENKTAKSATVMTLSPAEDPSRFNVFPDYLDRKAMAKFVDLSYDWYAREFNQFFGSTIKGEFTDNSCFSFGYVRRSVPWTGDLPERFKLKTGLELTDVLPGVFLNIPGCRRDRLVFWNFINEEYLESFIKPIDESCRRNGILSTGHYCIEDGNSEHVRQLGDRFDQKLNQGLPAVDMLGREKSEEEKNLLRMRFRDSLSVSIPGTASPAYFHKNSRVMCECMGLACGWGLDLAEIRRATGLLSVLGIDLFVPHGIYYSIAGHRKWECTPDHYHNPMWGFYREWTDWISKLSYLTSRGERTSETALLYPVTAQTAYLELGARKAAGKNHPVSDRGAVCDLIDLTWRSAGNALLENNISYEIIDETLIQSAKIAEGRMLVRSANGLDTAFRVIVLPCAKILKAKTVDKLCEWRKSGGKIIALNSDIEEVFNPEDGILKAIEEDAPLHDLRMDFESEGEFKSQCVQFVEFIRRYTAQPFEISGHDGKIVSKCWRKWDCNFALLHNLSADAVEGVRITWRVGKSPLLLDLDKTEFEEIPLEKSRDGYSIRIDFSPAQSVVLASGKDLTPVRKTRQKTTTPSSVFEIVGSWEFKTVGPNVLPLRSCTLEHSARVKRHIYRFDVADMPEKIGLALDCEMKDQELRFDRYFDRVICSLNGTEAGDFHPGTVFDRWIFEADVSRLVKSGPNELVIELASGLLDENRNCEAPMIFGDFIVAGGEEGKVITASQNLKGEGDWRNFGFPYYSGMASYRKKVGLPAEFCRKKSMLLSLGGIANSAEVLVNGVKVGRKSLPPWEFDISRFAGADILDLEVRIANTAKNLWDSETLPSGLFGPVKIIAC